MVPDISLICRGASDGIRGVWLVAFKQLGEARERREGRRGILLPVRDGFPGRINGLVPLMFIVVTIEAEEFPVAAVWWIVVVVVVFVVNRELAQPFAVELAPAVRADPGKEFECLLARGLFPLRPVVRCHARLEVNRDVIGTYSTTRREQNPDSVASV